MSLPRLILSGNASATAGSLIPLDAQQERHLAVLRLRPGDALEVVLDSGPWRAEVAESSRRGATLRLVGPLDERREPPFPILACLPLTAQLSLWDNLLPAAVELGATRILPIIYSRSEFDARRTAARAERWGRIVQASAEQSHRTCLPLLEPPLPFERLALLEVPQRWVAYELPTGGRNPELRREALAFTHGPEGGITDPEAAALRQAGWSFLTLGPSILRAVTCPAAILGALQFQLGRL
jgi:16S rRNA (uracil1498-N3)-methyltransferase